MKFQLLCGRYQDGDGKDYLPGDVIIGGIDLVRSFGSNMFRRLPDQGSDLTKIVDPAASQTPRKRKQRG